MVAARLADAVAIDWVIGVGYIFAFALAVWAVVVTRRGRELLVDVDASEQRCQ
jgi:ABC-type multidrug transport system permease subunit